MDRTPMRVVCLLLMALLLAGCQQAGSAAPDAGDELARDREHHALRFFEPEFAALQKQMLVNLVDACVSHAEATVLFDRCLRERVANAFDDSGEGRKQCAFHAEFGEFVDCVAMGNTFLDVMHRMTDTEAPPAGFWSGDDAMVRALSRSIVSNGVANCRSAADGPALNRCIDGWFEDHLQLSADLTRRCPEEAEARSACLVEAVMIRFMRDHVPRLTAIGV
jgi:hypothetical protein